MKNEDLSNFEKNGFIILKNVFDKKYLDKIKSNCYKLFKQDYQTGLLPDKIKWKKSDKKNNLPRSLCNIWKSNRSVASLSLNNRIGKIASFLMNWDSVRLNQDSVIWVPPKCGNVSFHQDEPYQDWHLPGKIITAWIPLSKTYKKGATIEYATGSHKWKFSKRLNTFLGANDYMYHLKKYTKKKMNIFSVEINKGDIVMHHGRVWHGSTINRTTKNRMSISIHLMSGKSKFHPVISNPLFTKFKHFNSLRMDESFFPIIWSKKKYRSNFINNYIKI